MAPPATVAPLFEPIQLGPLTLRNRIFMSALTRNRSVPTNVPNAVNLEYYQQRAKSAGLIITEGVLISQQGSEWPHAPGIWSKEQVAAWKKITDAVHKEGSFIYAQLWHLGRVSHPDAPEQKAAGVPVYAPSSNRCTRWKVQIPSGPPWICYGEYLSELIALHQLTYIQPTAIDDPTTLLDLFEKAAENAKEAGFDGVELHGANGYLIHQFLDSTSNTRTDSWGGSVANRAKFGLLALERLIKVFGKDRVSVKLTPCGGYNDMGMPLDETLETYSYFISEADKLGIVYIDLVRYSDALDPILDGKKRAIQHDVIDSYASLIKHAKVFSNSGWTPEEAAAGVKDGQVEGIFFGMLWINHPDVASRLEHEKPLDQSD
ncbi:flavo protein NADH-dependent oxidoreductase [Gymnopus androsaceus JB14]|uniref:Flavo protein NADH-dependent oxidoreductase n=1 Tax=Gymnopus androsaceus JB14 TaxID=1447944 RepID=A0A6A4GYD4_9AGAR|nr:flavo protein NADH-dependent oxidoreductase [Gymnopus androsaceus JB14]